MKNRGKTNHDIDNSRSPFLLDLNEASKLENDDLLKALNLAATSYLMKNLKVFSVEW